VQQIAEKGKNGSTTEHAIELLSDTLAAHFVAERATDVGLFNSFNDVIVKLELKAGCKADRPQNSERVIHERCLGWQWSANNTGFQICQALCQDTKQSAHSVRKGAYKKQAKDALPHPFCPILDCALIDVVKERVDGEVSSVRIIQRRADPLPHQPAPG